MKKKLKERSARFRFWRNMAMVLSGLIIGFLTGYFGSDHPIEFQKLFDRDMIYIGQSFYIWWFSGLRLPTSSHRASLIR